MPPTTARSDRVPAGRFQPRASKHGPDLRAQLAGAHRLAFLVVVLVEHGRAVRSRTGSVEPGKLGGAAGPAGVELQHQQQDAEADAGADEHHRGHGFAPLERAGLGSGEEENRNRSGTSKAARRRIQAKPAAKQDRIRSSTICPTVPE